MSEREKKYANLPIKIEVQTLSVVFKFRPQTRHRDRSYAKEAIKIALFTIKTLLRVEL